MTNNEEVNSTLKSTILGIENFNNHNRVSCLQGIPLSRLKHSLQLFSSNEMGSLQLLRDSKIAFRLHRLQIPTEIESTLIEKFPDEQERLLLNPEAWKLNTFSRDTLITKTEQLIRILEDAIEKARTSK